MIKLFYNFFALIVFFHSTLFLNAQSIRGIVREADTFEPIIGATVKISKKVIATDEYGHFVLSKSQMDTCCICVQSFGFEDVYQSVATSDSVVYVYMQPRKLKEIEVKGINRGGAVMPTQVITTHTQLKQFPSIGGVPDLFRALAAQPGVSTGGEIFSGLYVWGGNKDQNLFLLDGATIYGASHLFSIVSLFNSDVLKRAELFKGVFPARYGGRISSVLDVRFKEGRKDKLGGHFDLGLFNTSALLEGPIGKKQKSSFVLAGRTTYFNLLTLKSRKAYNDKFISAANYNNFNFYDFNGRINFEPNIKHKFNVNFYFGNDMQRLAEKKTIVLSNSFERNSSSESQKLFNFSGSIQWTNIINSEVSFHLNTSINAYLNRNTQVTQVFLPKDSFYSPLIFNESSLLQKNRVVEEFSGYNWATRAEWIIAPYRHLNFRTGIETILHKLIPGSVFLEEYVRDSVGAIPQIQKQRLQNSINQPFEFSQYNEAEINLFNSRLILSPGIRFSGMLPSKKINFEPRFVGKYKITPNMSFVAGGGRFIQYLHTLNGLENNYDKSIWVPSSINLPPQIAHTVSCGFTFNRISVFNRGISIEFYRKRASNQTLFNFKPDIQFPYANWTDKIIGGGIAKTNGCDLLASTQKGAFTGSIGYSLSRTIKQFNQFNQGRPFFDRFDRRHEVKVSGSYQPQKSNWVFSAFWSYHSGMRFTVPIGLVPSTPLFSGFPAYSGVNNLQMPAYHRLDLLAKYEKTTYSKWCSKYYFTFNLLNAYARRNPYGLELYSEDTVIDNPAAPTIYKLKAVSLFPVLPSVSFGLTF